MTNGPETFWMSLESIQAPALGEGDVARARARIEQEDGASELLQMLGFAPYVGVERRHHGGYGVTKHSLLGPVRREATWGEGA